MNLFLNIFSNKPWQVSYFYHKNIQKEIDRIIEKHLPKHIFCQLIRVTEYVKKYTIIPKTIDYMDALSKGIERRISVSSLLFSWHLKKEATRLKVYENETFKLFTNKLIISNQDKLLMEIEHKNELIVLPNGVNTTYFHPIKTPLKYDLVFTGNMSYPPNVDCVVYLVQEILPLVWKKHPHTSLLPLTIHQ